MAKRSLFSEMLKKLLGPPNAVSPNIQVPPPVVVAEVGTAVEPALPDTVQRYLRYFTPGHFYSPVPDFAEIARRATRIFSPSVELHGVDLREEKQLALFSELSTLALSVELDVPTSRYRSDNPNYGIGDALMLNAMLRHLSPKRYVEVGSGWSTCMALDTNERFLDSSMTLTAIEPHPELLKGLLHEGDQIEIHAQEVQDVDLAVFQQLQANDLLFIDCSHVVKTGSDAHYLVTRVLPVLAPGVFVHFHDMFWPFEYPMVWVEEGRAWSELYLLHAFLLFNDTFQVEFFNHWFAQNHPEEIYARLPRMLENPGGALWLSRQR